MTTYLIELTTNERLSPGNEDHIAAIMANPASRNFIKIIEVTD